MIEVKSPSRIGYKNLSKSVFLAGSIEMGVAEDWQLKLKNLLVGVDCYLMNPRRDDWDSSWVQEKSNPQFNEQVTWELEYLENTHVQVFYFDPATKSPITLMELGLIAGMHYSSDYPRKAVVCCPPGFWRRGNVEILCDGIGIPMVDSLEEIAEFIKKNVV